MGVTSGGSDGIGVDCEVGTIVWVRRRNGSWWPGRILAQHELSASHLMSPRSGTPVKLLGREDASVDWYNLEKSKRVKAFRCGEFDACIEKAEAAQGVPIKKREKYARREDAIIHALELERQMLEGRISKLGGSLGNKHSEALKKELAVDFPSGGLIRVDDTPGPGKLTKCRKVGLPVALATKGKSLSTDTTGMGDTLTTNEGGISDIAPRMRGLQDFGLEAVSSKRKISVSGSYENSKRSFLMDNLEGSHPGPVRDMDGWYNFGNRKSCSPSKNKRSPSGFNEESKRRDRRRPLLQVLQSSAKLQASPSMTCNGYASDHMKVWPTHFGYVRYLEEEKPFSRFIEPYEPEFPEELHLDHDMEQEETLLSSTSQSFVHELIDPGGNDEYGHGMIHVHEQDGSPDRYVALLSGRTFDSAADAGVSRWNLKGKRNIRKLSKRAGNLESETSIYNDNRGRSTQQGLYSLTGDSDDGDFIEKGLESELGPTDGVSYQPVFQGSSIDNTDSMGDSDKDSGGITLSGWDNEKLHHAPRRRHWDEPPPQFGQVYTSQFRDRIESRLVDVNLKVQASYQGERVPLVSLMSRLNGKAIIGHPLQVETLSDGFTNSLLSDNDYGGNPSHSYGSTTPAWRTGRRTSLSRIPRLHTTSEMEGEAGILHYIDSDSRITFNRPLPVHYDYQTRLVKKKSHSPRPSKKLRKKSSKRVGLSNLKTRTLSSLAKGQKHASAQNKGGKPYNKTSSLSILMKPGDIIPMVTCVPVKVVFSRILEAVGRSPSNGMVHRHLLTTTGPDDRKS